MLMSRADHAISLCPQKLALTSPTSGGRLAGIVRSRSQAKELFVVFCFGAYQFRNLYTFMFWAVLEA
jgi:hypothetical protein